MTDLDLAEEIERYLAKAPRSTMVLGYDPAVWQQIIAALRRGPELSGEMVVPREPTMPMMLAGSTFVGTGTSHARAIYRAMLSACEEKK